ncbi:hypothetical protein FPZ43_06290 [Mucilaginibacter pallidiroseus]|uniref:Uncharacterized protein n=1 Tax=Mucilaginibacter pallidiroseus TaxID=2599295 RepID=A0A563UGQ5_9SPHI|nr:DUF5687 family protein [Mucilaginibacter pallidiroseus]TWR30544.1 hypothetical protein FPZ43_06290 [Mucilaginibacter pallidiroseus]
MFSLFFTHELKSFWRSANTGKTLAIKIVMGILILILFMYVLALGLFLDRILEKAQPNENLTVAFCGILLIYYLYDILLRLQLQELPTLKVQPYLHLPVKRNTVVGYLAFTALFSFFNLWPIVLFVPFILKIILPASGALAVVTFIIAIIALALLNNYLALYIKRKANLNGFVLLIAGGLLALISAGDFVWHLFSLSKISYLFFGNLIKMPALVLLPLILAVVMYYINFAYLKSNLYLEELTTRKNEHKSSTEFPVLDRFGRVGDLVANEIKLILRNKRPRSALTMGLLFMFYGLIFYTNPAMPKGFNIFVGMFMTGIFIINYGQFMFSWQGAHFDGIMVSKVKFADFLKAKYMLFTIVSTVAFLLTVPYAYFGWKIVMIHFIMYIWNIGVNTTVVLFFANRNYKRIDLSKGASFNWEGVGATQLLLSFPLMLMPYLVYWPFIAFGLQNTAYVVLASIGILFIATRNFWIGKLTADFETKKYKIAEGFRNK